MNLKVLIINYLLFLISYVHSWTDVLHKNIDIKPGAGLQVFEVSSNSITCVFQCKAQGGTKENWDFKILKSEDKLKCAIQRPSGASYLFFEEFQFEFKGSKITNVYLEKQPGVVLPEKEYIIDYKRNTLSHKPGGFNSQLFSAQVEVQEVKSDL